ncbi:hypothetical protein [Colwellia psychrerythraea]|uniref:Uncharacterized protein n=1 Tax=Colwellia psychrerythraea TaxID=28229 RepID=A0A099L1F3_COLPS|nr:hypothetical protein [Colwellia psychrerythraea]KGJ96656.1 hypothetical protein GAB14E_1730 [Colwellia psychrerythraea]
MSTFNMTKNTNSIIKDVSLTLVLIGSLLAALTVSARVNAAPATIVENAVSNFVVAQGEKMIVELNSQLQQSIDEEIKAFSANFSLNSATTWLAAEQTINTKIEQAPLTLNSESTVTTTVTNKENSQ